MNVAYCRAERISFRSVNRRGSPEYDRDLQRHHLLPRQLLSSRCFGEMFDRVGVSEIGFNDFRVNGLLLPANENAATAKGLPLHRGPHRHYNQMVIERVGQIEESWSRQRLKDSQKAFCEAVMRMRLLQSALRTRLLQERRRIVLNRKDPLGKGFDFSDLDAMANFLYGANQTGPISLPSLYSSI